MQHRTSESQQDQRAQNASVSNMSFVKGNRDRDMAGEASTELHPQKATNSKLSKLFPALEVSEEDNTQQRAQTSVQSDEEIKLQRETIKKEIAVTMQSGVRDRNTN